MVARNTAGITLEPGLVCLVGKIPPPPPTALSDAAKIVYVQLRDSSLTQFQQAFRAPDVPTFRKKSQSLLGPS